jgi:integrase
MATIQRRRNRDGSTSWDVTVRRTGHPTACKSFPTKLEADLWSARTEARMTGRTSVVAREMTVADLIDEARARLNHPVVAVFDYWRETIGSIRLADVTPALIATHRDRLLGAPTGGYGYRKLKPRSQSTVRNYLVELARLFAHAVKEMHVMEDNPCARVAKPSASTWRVRFLSDAERSALLAACRTSDSPDLYAFVLFCLTTGCRKGEAAALLWRNVDFARRWAVFPVTKNGTARGVPLTQGVADLLRMRARDNDRVFPIDITSRLAHRGCEGRNPRFPVPRSAS